MTAQASHQGLTLSNPETAGVESMGNKGAGAEMLPGNNGYGVYVLEGTEHQDGSSGLIFAFNPDVLSIQASDIHQIAKDVRRSLLPLKRKEHELKSAEAGEGVEVKDKDLSFKVEASASPFIMIRDDKIVDENAEEVLASIESEGEGDEDLVMHSWPAIRLDYDTSLVDQASLIRAIGYVLSSNLPPDQRQAWMHDMAGEVNVERFLDQDAVRPGNPNRFVRNWLNKLIEEAESKPESKDSSGHLHNIRLSRVAASLSAFIKL